MGGAWRRDYGSWSDSPARPPPSNLPLPRSMTSTPLVPRWIPRRAGARPARAVLDNLYKFVVPAVAGPARVVPLAALSDERISLAALRNAADRGRLQAARGPDGQRRSWRNWVDDYLASRYRRRG
jgi:hypothetical protein